MAVAIGKSSGVVRQLVMMFGVNKRDEYNRTPLMFAALGNNKSSSCGTLIECGAEVDRQDICGLTALHVACYHGNKSAASVLLSKRASVCIFDNTVSANIICVQPSLLQYLFPAFQCCTQKRRDTKLFD